MKTTGKVLLLAVGLLLMATVFSVCETVPDKKADDAPDAAIKAPTGTIAEFADAEKGIYMRALPNGLRVVVQVNPTAPVVSCYALVHTGSIHEGEYLRCGMSHIFEHVMSGGTTTKRTEDETRELKELIGCTSNAATSKDYTIYYMTATSRYFPQVVDILGDYLVRCVFDEKELKREFGVITQEILKGQEEPSRLLNNLFNATAYDVHPVRYPIIGYIEDFLRVNRQDITKYYRERYVPENIVFSVAGDVDPEQSFAIVAEAFASFEARPLVEPKIAQEPAKHDRRYVEREANVRTSMMQMGFRTVKMDEPDMYPLDLLAFIAGRGGSSVLNLELKEKSQLVQSVYAYSDTPDYVHGHFVVGCNLDPAKTAEAEAAVIKTMQAFCEPLPGAVIEKAKKQMIATYIRYRQDVASQASANGFNVMHTGDPLHTEKYLAKIKKVTAADVARVSKKYFREDNLTTVVLKPRTGKTAQTLPPLEIEEKDSEFEKVVLENGLTVLLRRNAALPIVAMQVYSKGGVYYEGGKYGVSNMMAQMLLRGTQKRSATEISSAIDAVGGSIQPVAGRNTFGMEVEVLNEDAELGLDLLSDCLINPAFDEKEFDYMKRRVLYEIGARSNEWSNEIFDLVREKYYGEHPYGRTIQGTAASIEAMQRADVAAFHKRLAVGPNTVLAISGDFDTAEMKRRVERYFGAMSADKPDFGPLPTPIKMTAGKEKKFVEYNMRGQVNVVLCANGAPMGSEDQYAMTVLNIILSRRLHEALRGRNDFVYLVWAGNLPGYDSGLFYILAQTTPEKYDRVMEEIRREIDIVAKGEFSDEQLDAARRGAISFQEIGAQKNDNVASAAALDELYGYGYNFGLKFPGEIAGIGRGDVVKVAAKYFANWMIVETRPKDE